MKPRTSAVPGATRAGSLPLADLPDRFDVAKVRRGLLLSQGAFARRYGFSLPTLRNWEQGSRSPDAAARAYLTVIARDPERVAAVFAGARGKALMQLTWRELRAALDAADAAPENEPPPRRRPAPRQGEGAQRGRR
jgi:transcriptional regulator with XRE-family HTH domain